MATVKSVTNATTSTQPVVKTSQPTTTATTTTASKAANTDNTATTATTPAAKSVVNSATGQTQAVKSVTGIPAVQTATAADTTASATPTATMYSPTTLTNLQNSYQNAINAATGTNAATATGYTPTGIYDQANLDAYNKQREADIRNLYATAQQNTLAGLKTAYDQNLSDAQAARDLINPQYQSSANALSAEYERQRRNNNMQAAVNGLNTGAGSQMALAQSANYQANQAGLAQQQNQALDEANRAIADLQMNYQNAIAEATANNNYQLAASLLDEYENAYNRQLAINDVNYTRAWNEDERNYSRSIEEASSKAQYGDFSGYASIYGSDIANAMELTWALQNPQIAYAAGKLSAEDYQTLTGSAPYGITDTSGLKTVKSFYGGGGGYSRGYYGSGSGSSSTGTTKSAGTYTFTNTNPLSSDIKLGGIHSALGTSPASSSSDTSPSGGGTTYGNIGNNKLVVGGTQG